MKPLADMAPLFLRQKNLRGWGLFLVSLTSSGRLTNVSTKNESTGIYCGK